VGATFFSPVQTGPEAYPTSYSTIAMFFQGVKRPVCGADHASLSRAKVHARVELYLYSPFWALMVSPRVHFTFFKNLFSSEILMPTRPELHHCRPIRSFKVTIETSTKSCISENNVFLEYSRIFLYSNLTLCMEL